MARLAKDRAEPTRCKGGAWETLLILVLARPCQLCETVPWPHFLQNLLRPSNELYKYLLSCYWLLAALWFTVCGEQDEYVKCTGCEVETAMVTIFL